MQTVSENWKNVHKQTLLNESFVEVSLNIADPDALADVTSQDNGAVYISDTSLVVSEVDKSVMPYCTLEQNLWLLDGTRKAIPETAEGGNGYIGDVLSDDQCIFSSKIPVITLNFPQVYNTVIPGITIAWSPIYGEFPDTFIVTAYNGNNIVAQKEVSGNREVRSVVTMDISGYDRIVIMITKWCLPYHRARVEDIFVGMNKVYSKTDLFGFSHSQSVDPISTSLPKNEINFSLDNTNGEYDPYNNAGMAKYLTARQEVKTRYGLKQNDGSVEWINGGTFYLSEWYAKQNGLTAEFTARDLLEFMSAIYKDSNIFGYSHTLYSLAEQVLRAANLPLNDDGSVKWVIDESLKSISTTAPLPEDTIANCLQLIANAGGCVLYQDRAGILRMTPWMPWATDYKIDSFNSYSKSEITLSKPIKQVVVKVYTYYASEDSPLLVGGSITTEVIVPIGTTGETVVVDNPLIVDEDRATAIGAWVGNYLSHRMTLDSSWRVDVRLDTLDLVRNENDHKANIVCMTDVEFKFNGAFRGTGKGRVM